MNKQPDKIFRDKLLHYERPVSADAWKRVSENISPGNRTALWWKIAAGLLLLTSAGIFLFSLQGKRPAPFVAQQVEPNKADTPASQQITPEKKSVPEEVQEQATISAAPGKAETKIDAKRVAPTPAVRQQENPDTVATPLIEPNKTPTLAVTAGNALSENKGAEETSTQEDNLAASPARTRVTIVMNADEVNEKYLRKKNVVAEATPEEKESSGLQRLLDKAYDLKNNQDPLGDLRQKKNEILALNFRNNKQRHEN